MVEIIKETLIITSILLLIYGGVLTTHIIIGVYSNVGVKEELFEWSRLWKGVIKGIVIGVAISLGSVCISLIPYGAELVDISIPDGSKISKLVIFATIISSSFYYAEKVIDNFKIILSGNAGESLELPKEMSDLIYGADEAKIESVNESDSSHEEVIEGWIGGLN